MEFKIHTPGHKRTVKLTVADKVFAEDFNEPLIHQVLTAYMSGARAGTKAQKSRAEVRGGGRKPWRQKGLGRARAGTIRSPLWKGGGVTFAAKPRDHSKKVNKKMYRGAMRSIFSELARQQRLICVDKFVVEEARTKAVVEQLQALALDSALIITEEVTENLYLAARNLPAVEVIDTDAIEPYGLIRFDKVVITRAAVSRVESWLA